MKIPAGQRSVGNHAEPRLTSCKRKKRRRRRCDMNKRTAMKMLMTGAHGGRDVRNGDGRPARRPRRSSSGAAASDAGMCTAEGSRRPPRPQCRAQPRTSPPCARAPAPHTAALRTISSTAIPTNGVPTISSLRLNAGLRRLCPEHALHPAFGGYLSPDVSAQ